MKKYGPEKAKLLFTDTDSLTYHITAEDLYQDIKQDQHLYDTSNYPKEHFLYSTTNKKIIGKFKDETGGLPIVEWIGLRAKMYSIKLEDGKEKKTRQRDQEKCLKERSETLRFQRLFDGEKRISTFYGEFSQSSASTTHHQADQKITQSIR